MPLHTGSAKSKMIPPLRGLWEKLSTSFWFVPTLILLACMATAIALIEAESLETQAWLERWPRLFGVSADGARGMLSTIAGSMMTVVGVAFSMTLVTLALASSQYTSRILRNFMRDRVTQVTLGSFSGIFAYCLIVLRTIRGGDGEPTFIPRLAVTFGVLLAIAGIAILIFFIHRIATSIQASSIIASVASEAIDSVDDLFPEYLGRGPEDDEVPPNERLDDKRWHCVVAAKNGYIQDVDADALVRLAGENRSIVRMERGIGQFVVSGAPLLSLSLDEMPSPALIASLRATYSISRHRTLHNDCGFGIRQLVDISLRALSPGVNDTTTAVMCIDYLSAILARVANRRVPSPYRFVEGELKLIAKSQSFASLVETSFQQICHSSKGNVAIMLRTLNALQTIADLTPSASRRESLRQQMQCVAEVADRTLEAPQERTRFEERLAVVRDVLASSPMLSHPDKTAARA